MNDAHTIIEYNTMHFSITNNLLHFFFFVSILSLALSDPRISESGLYCGTNRLPTTKLVPTFVKEMEGICQQITAHHFATFHISNSSTTLYTLAQCHRDLSLTDCLICYAACRTKLPRCLPNDAGRIYLDGCFLRYDTYSFYGESVKSNLDNVKCGDLNGTFGGEIERLGFRDSIGFAVGNVSEIAVRNGGFGVFEAQGVYSLAQCWQSLSVDGCRVCLEKAEQAVRGCGAKKEGRAMNAGCYLRYSTEKFYNQGGDSQHNGNFRLGVNVAVTLAAAAVSMLLLCAACAGYVIFKKKQQECDDLSKFTTSLSRAGLNYKYETLEKATYYFNPSRKIGQGGSGSVYVGTLSSGQNVAVKRLVFNTRQWVDEFFNEVNLISGIQHKNLVKLLGCSIEGPESLLVYEYVPNKSLDHFLFDKNKPWTLNWKQRFNIIVGTAEGLVYLHGGAPVRIIHRDIKSSNILLDEDLTAKIADFGLVRCFDTGITHLSTGIAGTLGYMAPEYLIRGQLTEKADVYSFGVLVLEIVCGRRSRAFTDDSGSLLQAVWELYKSNMLAEAVDPSLIHNFPKDDALKVLQIGLLCTQASANLRPSMDQVLKMLTSEEYHIPTPSQPPFLNPKVIGHNTATCSTISLATKFAASYTSSEPTTINSSDGRPRSEELMQKLSQV